MQRRQAITMAAFALSGVQALSQTGPSEAQRELVRQQYQREEYYRKWLRSTGFSEFFGGARGPYTLVDGEPQDGRTLVALQAKQLFAVAYPAVELPSGHVILGAHAAAFAPTRCYAVLQGWSTQLVMVGLLHAFSGRTLAEREQELQAALAASAALTVGSTPKANGRVPQPRPGKPEGLPVFPKSFDDTPTLTVFTRAGTSLVDTLGRVLATHVRDQLRDDAQRADAMLQERAKLTGTPARPYPAVRAFKTEHRVV